jgi:hypothetical protein
MMSNTTAAMTASQRKAYRQSLISHILEYNRRDDCANRDRLSRELKAASTEAQIRQLPRWIRNA